MSKPQQPEIARSGRGATDPAAIKSELSAPRRGGGPEGETGPIPEDNAPGHRPEHDQDKPSGDAFLERMHEHALEAEEPEPTAAGDVARAAAGVVRKVRERLPGAD